MYWLYITLNATFWINPRRLHICVDLTLYKNTAKAIPKEFFHVYFWYNLQNIFIGVGLKKQNILCHDGFFTSSSEITPRDFEIFSESWNRNRVKNNFSWKFIIIFRHLHPNDSQFYMYYFYMYYFSSNFHSHFPCSKYYYNTKWRLLFNIEAFSGEYLIYFAMNCKFLVEN